VWGGVRAAERVEIARARRRAEAGTARFPEELAGQRRQHLAVMRADPDDHRHGTKTGYAYGCRCGRCKDAKSRDNAGRQRQQRQEAG
jgi:hypothetical protein